MADLRSADEAEEETELTTELRRRIAELEVELRRRNGMDGPGVRGRAAVAGRRTTRPFLGKEDLFRRLVSSLQDYAVFMLDPAGHVATWNRGAARIKGYTEDEIVGQHFSVFYPEEDVRAGKCEQELAVAVAEGRVEDEGWRVRKDGSRFWANVVITTVRDDDGQIVGFAKVTRDLTERKIAVEAEERFRLLVASVVDYAIFMLDPKGRVSSWNPGAQRLKGYLPSEIIGRHFSIFYTDEDIRAGKCDLELEVAGRVGRFEDEGWRVRKDGSRFWANVIISAMRSDQGELIGFAKVTRDLTERRASDEERAARRAAEQANQAKDEFLAMLGHELRNPLAPIVTALHLLRLRGESTMPREYEVIERQVRHMTRLVDDLLDVARIARGRIEMRLVRIDLRGVLTRAADTVATLVAQRRHHLELDLPAEPLYLEADEGRLLQVLVNLLTNAAKYTDPGGQIRLTAHRAASEIVIEVRDNGLGIPRDLLPNMFDLFVQGRQSIDRSGGGLGIGLSLVKSIVEMHGGSVAVSSAGPRQGSTFTVRLPVVRTTGPTLAALPPDAVPRSSSEPRSIMVVDDNIDALDVLADALTSLGHLVCKAYDATSALALAKQVRPEIVILDIGLPGIDGYQLAEHLRTELAPFDPAIVALTGYGQSADKERSRQAGFAAHLVKPADLDQLTAVLGQLIRG